MIAQINAADAALHDIDDAINGDPALKSHNEPSPPSLKDRVDTAVNSLTTTSAPTETHREALTLAEKDATAILERLRKVVETDLASIEKQMNALGAPWTPGRIPSL